MNSLKYFSHFIENGGGKVINISSIAGTGAFPNCPGYCASKGGVVNMTRALAAESGKSKINIKYYTCIKKYFVM